jgi:methylphosphotriester-DNA--protein-cysteine methyltransferase
MQLFKKIVLYFISKFGPKEQRVKLLFEHHFFVNRYYLHKSANKQNLARILNISNIELDELTTKNFQIGFDALIEMYRFQHFWDEFTNPVNAHLPIQSIISICGFSSNQEFNNLISGHKEASKMILKKAFV